MTVQMAPPGINVRYRRANDARLTGSSSPSTSVMIGETLSRYRIVDTIGSGGWASSIAPTTRHSTEKLLSNSSTKKRSTARRRAIDFSARRGPFPS